MMKNAIKIMIIVAIAFFFLPMFAVSCSGMGIKENVSAAHVVVGYEDISKPNPVAILALTFPCCMLAVWFIKTIKDKVASVICAVLAVAQFIFYTAFGVVVKSFCEDNLCQFEVLGWYYINNILLAAIFGLAVYIAVKGDGDIYPEALKITRASASGESWTCPKCNINYPMESKFCGNCGMNYNEAMAMSGSVNETAGSEPAFCPQCGASLGNGASFCGKCGYRL